MKKLTFITIITTFALSAGAFETPTMGWSSWNTYGVNINDSVIRSQADAMVKTGLAKIGYNHINIDDGFQGGRDEKTGQLLINRNRFPNGLKPIVDHIHKLGLKAGIYSDAGENTCGNYFDNDSLSVNVGLLGHEAQDCDLYFNQLGFDFIKVDYCGGQIPSSHKRYWLDTRERYEKIHQAMLATGRDDLRLNVCRWAYPGAWVYDVASSWRMSGDINCSWQRVREIIDENLYLSGFARNGHYNDMDMLEVGRTLTQTEDETHFGLWCMMSSPLLIGCDVTTLRPETFNLLSNPDLIAINQDVLGKQAYVVRADSTGGYTFARDIKERGGKERAVAFYNPTDSEIRLEAELSEFDLIGPAKVYDALHRKKMPDAKSTISVTLSPHATEIYTLKGKDRLMRTIYEAETAFLGKYQELHDPHFVGSAYHIRDPRLRGGVGVANAGVTADNDIVFEEVIIPSDGSYRVSIHYLPKKTSEFYISADDEQGYAISPTENGDDIMVGEIDFELNKGVHKIRLYSGDVMPVIDYITIEPKSTVNF